METLPAHDGLGYIPRHSPEDGPKLCASNCDEYCCSSKNCEWVVWLAETDTKYGSDCLVEHFIDEIRALTGLDEELEDWTFIAMGDSEDEFTHFECKTAGGVDVEITLHQLEVFRNPPSSPPNEHLRYARCTHGPLNPGYRCINCERFGSNRWLSCKPNGDANDTLRE